MSSDYQLKYYNSIEAKEISWLWYPYIPYGKITIVQGDPGEGKTTLMLEIAAILTKGESIISGMSVHSPTSVLFQTTEDSHEDTIKPRLLKAGADCSKIAFIDTLDESPLNIADERFYDAIMEISAKLLVIDPYQGFIHQGGDVQKPGFLRGSLARLSKIAENTGCAIVLIGHMNKSNSGKGIYRGLGSIDITAAARSVLLVARDPTNSNRRIILPIKSNLAPEGRAYSFILDPDSGFQWGEECDYTAEELLRQGYGSDTKIKTAKEIISVLLDKGDLPSNELYSNLKEKGISKRTAGTARKELPINVYRKDNMWYWRLLK